MTLTTTTRETEKSTLCLTLDYNVFSLDRPFGNATDHGVALTLDQVPWAEQQLWAPDAAEKDGQYFLYFPAKKYNGLFAIGVAISDRPEGPFLANDHEIAGTYSTGVAVFEDDDGQYYMYFGGTQGGQLQHWNHQNEYVENPPPICFEPGLAPRIAKLSGSMVELAEEVRPIAILGENGKPLRAVDKNKRFFEGSWMHKYNDTYYFSYSTGDTHNLCYATGESPYGPFTYRGKLLLPVIGWTTHHSIVEYHNQWYLFYHDSQLSCGVNHLRNIKMVELNHNPDGSIPTIDPYC